MFLGDVERAALVDRAAHHRQAFPPARRVHFGFAHVKIDITLVVEPILRAQPPTAARA
jgi:hypothetical protein